MLLREFEPYSSSSKCDRVINRLSGFKSREGPTMLCELEDFVGALEVEFLRKRSFQVRFEELA